jgi:hypothetical protein
MNPKYPVYVISKGRSTRCLTARELTEMNVPFSLVVEPQEVNQYRKAWPNARLIETPFSNLEQGSIPVRNFVWDLAAHNVVKRYWILDDNIEGFHRLHKNEKYKVADGTIFRCCEDFVDRFKNIPMAGMNYYSFCKKTDAIPPFYLNTRIYSCILIETSRNERWRGRYNEDTDLSIRFLKQGLCTVLFNAFLCGKVTTMRMKGGNTDLVYALTNNRKEFAESLVAQHPDVAKITFKFGRWHHNVDYRSFKKNKLEYYENINFSKETNNYGMRLESKKQNIDVAFKNK